MSKLFNLARMVTPTVGGGPITLGAAVHSFLSFDDAGAQDGDTITYAIEEGDQREIGRGIYNETAKTLTRNVLRSTNGNNPINLNGKAQIFVTAAAEDLIAPDNAIFGRRNGDWLPMVAMTEPTAPIPTGQLWFDATANELKLRTNGSWATSTPSNLYLPLAGGTLNPVISGVPNPGLGLTIDCDWTAPAITINASDWAYGGMNVNCDSGAYGIVLSVNDTNSIGMQMLNSVSGTNVSIGGNIAGISIGTNTDALPMQIQSAAATPRLLALIANNVATIPLDIIHTATTTAPHIRILNEKSTTLSGDGLGVLGFAGGRGAGVLVNAAIINAVATQNWSATQAGSQLQFMTTPNGTLTPQTAMILENTGTITVGTPTGPAVTGAGNINIAGSYHVNGVSIGTGPFLPLAGGTMQTVTDTGGGIVIPVNDSSWGNPGIRMDVTDGWGLVVNSGPGTAIGHFICNGGVGLEIQNNTPYSGAGGAIVIQNGVGSLGINVRGGGIASIGIEANVPSSGRALLLRSNVVMGSGDGNWLVLQRYIQTGSVAVGNNQTLGNIAFEGRASPTANSPAHRSAEFLVRASQAWSASAAGTEAVFRITPNNTNVMQEALRITNDRNFVVGDASNTPAGPGNINVSNGYYINGVSIGTPPFLPLAGGTVTGDLTLFSGQAWVGNRLTMKYQGYPDPFVVDTDAGFLRCTNLAMILSAPSGPITPLTIGTRGDMAAIVMGKSDWATPTVVSPRWVFTFRGTTPPNFEEHDFRIQRCNNVGAYVDEPLTISGDTGAVTLNGQTAPFLPLAGGTLTPPNDQLGLDINNTGTGNSLRIRNGATNHLVVAADGMVTRTPVGAANGLVINSPATATGFSLDIDDQGSGTTARIRNRGATHGLEVSNWGSAATSGHCININNYKAGTNGVNLVAQAGTGNGVTIDSNGPTNLFLVNRLYDTGTAILIWRMSPDTSIVWQVRGDGSTYIRTWPEYGTNPTLDLDNRGTGNSLRIRNGLANHFIINGDGSVTMSPAFKAAMQAALA